MKKKQQPELTPNHLINRLYRSKGKKQISESYNPVNLQSQNFLKPKITLKHRLAPIEINPLKRGIVQAFLQKKKDEAKKSQHIQVNTSRIRSKMLGNLEYSEIVGNTFQINNTKPNFEENKQTQEKEQGLNYLTPDDFMQIIKMDKQMSQEFCYLKKKDNPYNWQIVQFDYKDPNQYMVISKRGLTKYINNVAEFMSFQSFMKQAKIYNRIMSIGYYKNYKKWKNFSIWKKLTTTNRMKQNMKNLDNNIVISDQDLKQALLKIHYLCKEIEVIPIFYTKIINVMTLEQFIVYIEKQRTKTQRKLVQIQQKIRQILQNKCSKSMETFMKKMRISKQKNTLNQKKIPLLIGDQSGKQMPYTQQATIKTHQKKIRNFIKMIDYLILNSKVQLFKKSSYQMNKVVAEMNRMYIQNIRNFGINSWVVINIKQQDNKIYFLPCKADIIECFQQILFGTIGILCENHSQYIHQQKFIEYSKQREGELADEYIELQNIINNDQQYNYLINCYKQNIEISFGYIETHSKILQQSLLFLQKTRSLKKQSFEDKDSEFFRDILSEFRLQIQKLHKIQQRTEIGLFLFDFTQYRILVQENSSSTLQIINQFIPDYLHRRAATYLKEINANYNKIIQNPVNLPGYVAFLEEVREVSNQTEILVPKINDIIYLVTLTQQFGVRVQEVIKNQVSQVNGQVIGLKRRLEQISRTAQSMLEKFKKQIEKLIPTFNDRLKVLQEKLDSLDIFKITKDIERKIHEIEHLFSSLKVLNKDRENLNGYQVSLSLDQTQFQNIDKYTLRFNSIYQLWKSKYEWEKLMKYTQNTQLNLLNLPQINSKIEQTEKTLLWCQRQLDPNQVLRELQNQIEFFRPIYQCLVGLTDSYLQQSHLEEIRELIQKDNKQKLIYVEQSLMPKLFKDMLSPELTIKFFKRIKIYNHKDEIIQITQKAKIESELLKSLNLVQSFWKNNLFNVIWYKGSKDSPILGNNEDLISKIDDNLMVANNILASKYIGILKNKVQLQFKMLRYLQQLIDELYIHQKNWMYLQPILKSNFAVKNLPKESNQFAQADAAWKRIMKLIRDSPSTKRYGQQYNSKTTLTTIKNNIVIYETLQKSLQQFLQRKRQSFGRFFLLSNQELLQILSNIKQQHHIQAYISKVFSYIDEIEIDEKDNIVGMKNNYGERIPFKNCLFKGEVQQWFKSVQQAMKYTLKVLIRTQLLKYNSQDLDRIRFIINSISSQVVLLVDQIAWANTTEIYLEGVNQQMDIYDWFQANNNQLKQEIEYIKKQTHLTTAKRITFSNLIIQNIHQRDVIDYLTSGCQSKEDYKWIQQLRFYYEEETVHAKNNFTKIFYSYQYKGVQNKLVMNPLTERVWYSIFTNLSFRFSSLLVGKTGSGKTQIFSQLANLLGKNSIVYDSSKQLSPKIIEKLLIGISYTGSWICLQQINHLTQQVLSVLAQQLFIIRQTLISNSKQLKLGEKHLIINQELAIIMTIKDIKTELPFTLKFNYRSINLFAADLGKILQILLCAEGFISYKELSKKVTTFFNSIKYLLTQQSTFNFGQREISTLIKKVKLSKYEDSHSQQYKICKIIKEFLIPQLQSNDINIFNSFFSQIFPNFAKLYKQSDQKDIRRIEFKQKLRQAHLSEGNSVLDKLYQISQLAKDRFSIILLGQSMTGKSSFLKLFLQNNYNTIGPKSFQNSELFGFYNPVTQNWKDGIISKILKQSQTSKENIIFDGPIDSSWVELLNPLLDNSHTLCLPNGQRIRIKQQNLKIYFETEKLSHVIPSLASRCGIIYVSNKVLGWQAIVESYFNQLDQKIYNAIGGLVKSSFKKGILFIRKNCKQMINTTQSNLLESYCKIIRNIINNQNVKNLFTKQLTWKKLVQKICIFGFTWSLGAVISSDNYGKFDKCLTQCFSPQYLKVPMFNYLLTYTKPQGQWVLWSSFTDNYQASNKFYLTKEVVTYKYFMLQFTKSLNPILFISQAGNCKSIVITNTLKNQLYETTTYLHMVLPTYTNSKQIQLQIESKLQSQRKQGVISLLPPPGKKFVCVIEDSNMAHQKSQGIVQNLRMLLHNSIFWDRNTWVPKTMTGYQFVFSLSCQGACSTLDSRFLRYFNIFYLPPIQQQSIVKILSSFIGTFKGVKIEIAQFLQSKCLIYATIQFFNYLKSLYKPSPANLHYSFNLYHIIKVFDGIEKAFQKEKQYSIKNADTLVKLWIHEIKNVFTNRISNIEHRRILYQEMKKKASITLKSNLQMDKIFNEPLHFTYINKQNNYQQIKNYEQLLQKLNQFQQLHYTKQFVQHLLSTIRAITFPRGNYFIIGPKGTGRRTIAKLACKILNFKFFSIQGQITNDKLLHFYKLIVQQKFTYLLFLQTPELQKLEEINQLPMLNKELLQEMNKVISNNNFSDAIQNKLHITLAFSPHSESFKSCMRKFPSLLYKYHVDYWLNICEQSLYKISVDSILVKDQQIKFEQIITKLYGCTNLISLSQYYSFFNAFNHYSDLQSQKITTQKIKVTTAIQKYQSTIEKIKLNYKQIELNQLQLQNLISQTEKIFVLLEPAKQQEATYKQSLEIQQKITTQQTQKISQEKGQADKILNEALPTLHSTIQVVSNLSRNDISQLKQLSQNPHYQIKFTLQCIAILLNQRQDMENIKKILNDANFLQRLKTFDIYNIPKKIQNAIKAKLATNPNFKPQQIKSINLAAKSICQWIIAVSNFSDIYKQIQIKKNAVQKMNNELEGNLKKINQKKIEMQRLSNKAREIQKEYIEIKYKQEAFALELQKLTQSTKRGEQITTKIVLNYQNWKARLHKIQIKQNTFRCDIFMAVFELIFLSNRTANQKSILQKKIKKIISEYKNFKLSENYQSAFVLTTQQQLHEYATKNQLPAIHEIFENLNFVKNSLDTLLIIDPQNLALKWINNSMANVNIISNNQLNFLKSLMKLLTSTKKIVIVVRLIQDLNYLKQIRNLINRQFNQVGGKNKLSLNNQPQFEINPDYKLYFIIDELKDPSQQILKQLHIVNFATNNHGLELIFQDKIQRIQNYDKQQSKLEIRLQEYDNSKTLDHYNWKIIDIFNRNRLNLLEDLQLFDQIVKCHNNIKDLEFKNKHQIFFQNLSNLSIRIRTCYSVLRKIMKLNTLYRRYDFSYFMSMVEKIYLECKDLKNQYDQINYFTQSFKKNLLVNVLLSCHHQTFLCMMYIEEKLQTQQFTIQQLKIMASKQKNKELIKILWELYRRQIYETVEKNQKELEVFVKNPISYLKAQKIQLIDSEELIIQKFTDSKYNFETKFQKKINKGFEQYLTYNKQKIQQIKQIIKQSPNNKIIAFLFEEEKQNPTKIIQSFATQSKIKIKIISLGDPQKSFKIDSKIQDSITTGGWVLLENAHLSYQFIKKKQEQIQIKEKIHKNFKLFITCKPIKNISHKFIIISNFFSRPCQLYINQQIKSKVFEKLKTFHRILGESNIIDLKEEDWKQVVKISEPVIKNHPDDINACWDYLKFSIIQGVYSSKIVNINDKNLIIRIFQELKDLNDIKIDKKQNNNQIVINYLKQTYKQQDKKDSSQNIYDIRLKKYQDYLQKLPLPIKKINIQKSGIATTNSHYIDFVQLTLLQEAEKYNRILKLIESNLNSIIKSYQGQIIINDEIQEISKIIYQNKIPLSWRKAGFPSFQQDLEFFFKIFTDKVQKIRSYLNEKPKAYNLSVLFSPQSFFIAFTMLYSKKFKLPFSNLSVCPANKPYVQSQTTETSITEGIFIQGLLSSGFTLDIKNFMIKQSPSAVMNPIPILYFKIVQNYEISDHEISIPVYKTNEKKQQDLIMNINCKINENINWNIKNLYFVIQEYEQS